MSKILYAASTMSHINNFHRPYIDALKALGHEVMIMANGEGADFDIPFVKKMLSLKNTACRSEIRKILKREKFDTVILNTTLAAFHIRLAMPKKNRPRVVNIVHGYLFSAKLNSVKANLLLWCERILRKKTDEIIVMNEEDLRIAKRHKLCLGKVTLSLGMGATVKDIKTAPEKIRKHISAEDSYLLCFVGELSSRKNQRFLICALPELKIRIPKVKLVFVGSGDKKDELEKLAEKLHVSDAVCFYGYTPTPCDVIYASDLYVSASEVEGMPFNIIEALGVGKTLLISGVKGHVDLITHGENGYIFGHANILDFAEKVKAIYSGELTMPDEEKIRETYEKYSFANVYEQTLALIKEAAEL